MVRIRFLLDEHIDHAIARGLRRRGIDVITPEDAGLKSYSDPDVLTYALREQRVVITHDRDLLRLHKEGHPHAGIAFCEAHSRSIGQMIDRLIVLYEETDPHDMANFIAYL
ncbi:MAG: hypothetical protein DCC58_20355 [Chloroflexi bacterium]|nr:MAG: hypothetical protein DCC58_20355 [Chloroflexota bacterium]